MCSIVEFVSEIHGKAVAELMARTFGSDVDDEHESILSPRVLGFVYITEDGRVRGAVVVQCKEEDEAHYHIKAVAVDKKCQGRGIGTLLMSRFLHQLTTPRITLCLDPNWEYYDINCRFYSSFGFSKRGMTVDGQNEVWERL